jgi:hypothetical protein
MIYPTTHQCKRRHYVDPRVAELMALTAEEHIALPLPIELILWLEDRGLTVDLVSGEGIPPIVGTPTASGKAVAHLLTSTPGGEL